MEKLTVALHPWMFGFYAGLFILFGILYYFDPVSRKRTATAIFMAVCSLIGLLATGAFGATPGGLVKLGSTLSRLLAVIAAVNGAGTLLFSFVLPKVWPGIPKLMEDIILACAYAAAALAVISASGANLSGIMATSAVVTAVVAFSLQDTLGNIIGGMVLHLENAFMPGDRIKIEGNEGIVREIRWRQTTLETPAGDLIIIPNIIVMKNPVTILGRACGNMRFRTVSFNVYYDRAPGEVIGAVERALREDPPDCVAVSPAPDCVVKEFQGGSVAYEARYWLTDLARPGVTDSAVRSRVYYALSREGIKLSVLARSMVVTEAARDAAEKTRQDEENRRLNALNGADVFAPLTAAERKTLAGKLRPTPFTAGELITRQGAAADWLYIIYAGSVEVRLESGRGSHSVVKTLGPGDFLGEMGLFTGEPRTATAAAVTDVRCYRLDKESFGAVLASRPEIAESIALLLARRRLELEKARGVLDDDRRENGLKAEQQNLFSRIKTFFSI